MSLGCRRGKAVEQQQRDRCGWIYFYMCAPLAMSYLTGGGQCKLPAVIAFPVMGLINTVMFVALTISLLSCTSLPQLKSIFAVFFKAIGHYRCTNNLQGLQKVMVKDFPWNTTPWNPELFEKTLKQLPIHDIENYRFILNTRHETAKQGWLFPLFSPDLDNQLSLNFHRLVILYISYDTRSVGLWTILLTDVVGLLRKKSKIICHKI